MIVSRQKMTGILSIAKHTKQNDVTNSRPCTYMTCMCTCIHMPINTQTCMCACAHTHTHKHTYRQQTDTHTHTHKQTHTHTHTHTHTCNLTYETHPDELHWVTVPAKQLEPWRVTYSGVCCMAQAAGHDKRVPWAMRESRFVEFQQLHQSSRNHQISMSVTAPASVI